MICRNCGTEIADKAIVCYRCGTATTDPVRKPAEIRKRRGGTLVPLVGLIVLILAGLYLGEAARVSGSWHAGFEAWTAYVVVLAIAIALVLFRYLRRR
jgi:multisubunit Na+/H+ antiporter MnhB subunit